MTTAAELRALVSRFFTDPDARRAPQDLYRLLVTEAPLLPLDDAGRMWVVSGYEHVVTLCKDPAATADYAASGLDLAGVVGMADVITKMLPMRGGADHTRLRRLVTAAFSARATETMRELVRVEVDRLLDELTADGSVDSGVDLVASIAQPLPVRLSSAMLDVPEHDRPQIADWAALITSTIMLSTATAEARERLDRELGRLFAYVDRLCAERLRNPGEDLISVVACAEQRGVLDVDELRAFVVMLFVNGLETLTNGVSIGLWNLLTRPEYAPALRSDPDARTAFFAEALRLHAPVRGTGRLLTRPVTLADPVLGDVVLPAGSGVLLLLAAANYDPRSFVDPARFDPGRRERGLSFGHGVHHCIGAPLSRMAGAEVLRQFATRFPDAALAGTDAAEWHTALPSGGLRRLDVRLAAPVLAVTR